MLHRTSILSTALLGLIASSTAFAADGVFQINQTCASFGCFTGDLGELPVTITQPGSYILTSNLTVSTVDQTAITVTADDVTIDLNGYAIRGPITCSGSPVTCSGQASSSSIGNGIRGSFVERMTVHNGRVIGMGGVGIAALGFNSATVYDVVVAENGFSGMVVESGIVHDVIAELNGQSGIANSSNGNVRVRDSFVRNNGNHGLGTGSYCSGVVSTGNPQGTTCKALGPNQCETPTNCD